MGELKNDEVRSSCSESRVGEVKGSVKSRSCGVYKVGKLSLSVRGRPMKSFKLWMLVAVILAGSVSVFAQTTPDLENGFKYYGSYDGSHLDTVNLMNGNLMLHLPLVPEFPQRGNKLDLKYLVYLTSK